LAGTSIIHQLHAARYLLRTSSPAESPDTFVHPRQILSKMADHSTIPIAITYHKPGTEPPLFVAGSFSAWEPQEMDCTTDEDGKHVFVKTVRVPPGTQIQYKFRVGQGDWWVLNDEAPTGT
jgi:hypothetical protein